MRLLLTALGCILVWGRVWSASSSGTVQPVYELLQRTVGGSIAAEFNLTIIDVASCDESASDCFEISDADTPSGKTINIAGSSLSALSTAVGVYLKRFCNASLTWANTGGLLTGVLESNGNNGHKLPSVGPGVRANRQTQFTYYMNVVDSSYSFVWWNFTRWQQEIDWMALHGVNLALAYTGQEYIFKKLYEAHGLNDTDMGEFFGGPAYLSWSRGQGLSGTGGPLPAWWYQQQAELNVLILNAMRKLNMTPILPGFQGNVPTALHRIYPKANISHNGWLDALDPLFPVLADEYMKLLIETFGTDHYYQADGLFSAGKAPWSSHSPRHLHSEPEQPDAPLTDALSEQSDDVNLRSPPAAAAIDPDAWRRSTAAYTALNRTDKDAVWVYQTWIWRGYKASHLPYLRGWIGAVPPNKLLLLDQTAEREPLWSLFDDWAFLNTSFVWCAMHDMGGNVGLFGDLQTVSDGPVAAFGTGVMKGVGIDPEGINQNPAYYEMVLESAWRNESINVSTWLSGATGSPTGCNGGLCDEGDSSSETALRIDEADANTGEEEVSAAAGSSWAAQRCGSALGSPRVERAWRLLGNTVYAHNQAQHYEHHMKYCPTSVPPALSAAHWSLPVVRPTFYNTTDLHEAWGLLLDAAEAGECHSTATLAAGRSSNTASQVSPALAFDIVDVGREYLSVVPCLLAYDALAAAGHAVNASAAKAANATMTSVLQDLDRLLLSAPTGGFLLGRWLRDARALVPALNSTGSVDSDKDAALLELNARAQVTTWSPVDAGATKIPGLYDYGNKAWGGLVKPYYLKRYKLYANAVVAAATAGAKLVDMAAYETALMKLAYAFQYQTHWSNTSTAEPADPVGDPVAIARQLWTKYAPA